MNEVSRISRTNWIPRTVSDTYPVTSKKANEIIDAVNALAGGNTYQGGIDCSKNPNYPAATENYFWAVSVAGLIGGASGKAVEVGDIITCIATNLGGTEALVGTSFIVTQKNMVSCTVAVLRTGIDNSAFVTAKTLKDQGITTSAETIVALTGGTTEQLKITTATAVKAFTVSATAQTGTLMDVTASVADANVNLFSIRATKSAGFTTAKTLKGYRVEVTSDATDVDGSTYIGNEVSLVSTALSKASLFGYDAVISGTASAAAAGTQSITGFHVHPTITLNSAATTFRGISIDVSGMTNTLSAASYGIYINANSITTQLTYGTYVTDGTRTIGLVNSLHAMELTGASLITGTGVTADHLFDVTGVALTTGSIWNFAAITTKTSGYLYNGSMTTSVLDASTLLDDFSVSCAHDGLAADTLRMIRRIWTGTMPNGIAAPDFILQELQWNSVFGGGGAIGGTPRILSLYSSATINDSAANFTALDMDLSAMTLTSVGNVYGINLTTKTGFDAAIYQSGNATSGLVLAGTFTTGISIGACTTAIQINSTTGTAIDIDASLKALDATSTLTGSSGLDAISMTFNVGTTEAAATAHGSNGGLYILQNTSGIGTGSSKSVALNVVQTWSGSAAREAYWGIHQHFHNSGNPIGDIWGIKADLDDCGNACGNRVAIDAYIDGSNNATTRDVCYRAANGGPATLKGAILIEGKFASVMELTIQGGTVEATTASSGQTHRIPIRVMNIAGETGTIMYLPLYAS